LAKTQVESSDGRTKVAVLTANGREARRKYNQFVEDIEQSWKVRFGEDLVVELRSGLEDLQGELFAGLEPYADGWRAAVPKLGTLPHFPMILHRGGFPDGS
jgi:hypothetical protein